MCSELQMKNDTNNSVFMNKDTVSGVWKKKQETPAREGAREGAR